MKKRRKPWTVFLCAALLAVPGGTALAATSTWTGGGADSLWTTAANWDAVPAAGDLVHVDAVGNSPLVNMDVAAQYDNVYFGVSNSSEVVLNMQSGGTLRTDSGGYIVFGRASGSHARCEMTGGSLSAGGRQVRVGESGTGTLNMSGGDITVSDWVGVGVNSSGTGTFNMSGGSVNAYNINPGNAGKGTVDISGGTVKASNWIGIAKYSGAAGSSMTVRNSGSVETKNLSVGLAGNGTLNLQGGTLDLLNTGRMRIGEGAGAGTFNVSGGQAYVDSYVSVGYSTSSIGTNAVRVTGGSVDAWQIVAGDNATGRLEVSGAGQVAVRDWIGVGKNSNGNGAFTLTGGQVDTYKLSIGLAGTGAFTMTDGVLNLTTNRGTDARIRLGEGAGLGVWNMEGGTVYAPKDIVVGYSTSAGSTDLLNMSGGDVYAGTLVVGRYGDGTVTLSGGSLYLNYAGNVSTNSGADTLLFDTNGGDGTLDLAGGELVWMGGDFTAQVNAFVASGDIVADGGAGTVTTWFDGTDTIAIPEPATLGLLAFLGGAMVWIRRRFMI